MKARWPTLLVACVSLLALTGALLWQWQRNPTHEGQDVLQERLDVALPPLRGDGAISQTFVCGHDGLQAIEFLLVVYDASQPVPDAGLLTLTLQQLDRPDAPPVISSLPTQGLTHNQRVRFSFAPQTSLGQRYRLTLRSAGVEGVSFWTTAHDAYADGEMVVEGSLLDGNANPPSASPDIGASDLYFVTYYGYALRQAIHDALRGLAAQARHLPAVLALLFLPGLALWAWLWPGRWRRSGVSVTLVLALSLASWPLLLLWTTTLGLRLGPAAAWTLTAFWGALAGWGLWRRRAAWGPLPHLGDWLPDLALWLVLALALATRWWHVRDLLMPVWVDSMHHTLITKIVAERGIVPLTLAPYAELDNFHYHYGFHANAAALVWLTGLRPEQAVLLLGQLLNALAALSVAGLGVFWSRRRWAAPVAALTVAILAFMPAYFVSWGRYTQLAGLVLLPGLLMASEALLRPSLNRRARHGMVLTAAILLAGLGLTHYRVSIFVALWAPLAALLAWARFGSLRYAARALLWAALGLALLAGLLILPWMTRFAALVLPSFGTKYGGMAAAPELDTAFPVGLLAVGWTRPLLYVAAAAAVWALLRRRWALALLPLWAGLCFLLANVHLLGLPDLWLIHNLSVFISFWLPVGLLIGWLAADLLGLLVGALTRLARCWGSIADPAPALGWLMLTALLALGGWRAWQMVDVVNPVTQLVSQEDMVALRWAGEHLPEDALVLINTRRWQGELRCGADAGWWLPILTDRQVTLPCVLYGQGDPAYVAQVNGLARAVEEATSLDDPALLAMLREAGVTHIYVGSRGGRLMPKDLDGAAFVETLLVHGATRIYRLR